MVEVSSAGRAAMALIFLLAMGCGAGAQQGSAAAPEAENGPSRSAEGEEIQAEASVISAHEALGMGELLARADRLLAEEKWEDAAREYEKVVDHASRDDNRLRALFGWGTALDLASQPSAALRVYSRYVTESPPNAQRDEAVVRQVRLLVYLERYKEAGAVSHEVDLQARTPLQQLALLAARAHEALGEERLEDAGRAISKGRAIVDANLLDRVTVPPLDVASLFFALGELRSRRAEAIKFDPVPLDFTLKLEERCQLILDAQTAYSQTMRSEDAHWSSMAGVKVGHLYKSLHADLMSIPLPEAATTDEKRKLFEGAMRLRYSILMRKSLAMMEATVALLDRTHQKSRWREKAREALREIAEAQKAEEAAIDALPYSRTQLQQVLDDMAAKARSSVSGTSGSPGGVSDRPPKT